MTSDEIEISVKANFDNEPNWALDPMAVVDFAIAIHDQAKEESRTLCNQIAYDWSADGQHSKANAALYLAGKIRASKVNK